MAAETGAGDLTEHVAFDKPMRGTDGGGGVHDGFSEVFCCRAAFIHLRGGETVLQARLQGQHTQAIRVRASSSSRAVTPAWRVRDRRSGTEFAIRDITPSVDRLWIDFLVQSGAAS